VRPNFHLSGFICWQFRSPIDDFYDNLDRRPGAIKIHEVSSMDVRPLDNQGPDRYDRHSSQIERISSCQNHPMLDFRKLCFNRMNYCL
jgi:hypothetical protein